MAECRKGPLPSVCFAVCYNPCNTGCSENKYYTNCGTNSQTCTQCCPPGTYISAGCTDNVPGTCSNCDGTLHPWQYWSSYGGTSASGCSKKPCWRYANEYYTAEACGCHDRVDERYGNTCPKANCDNLGADEYWSSPNGTVTFAVTSTTCPKAKCNNARNYEYYSGPTGDVPRFSIDSCPVSTCTNAANNQYYSGEGGTAAPATDSCPVANCTNPLPAGYYWYQPGYTTTYCTRAQCSNALANNQYYSSSGWLDPLGCAVSYCLNAKPPTHYWSANGFNGPTDCQHLPCDPKPDNSSYQFGTVFLSAACPWACDQGFHRNATLGTCELCPSGTFSLAGADACTPCTMGLHYPTLHAAYLPTGPGQSSCAWQCDLGYTVAPGLRCVESSTTIQNELTIKKFALVADAYSDLQANYTRLARLNLTTQTTETLTTLPHAVRAFAAHPSGDYAFFANATALYTVRLASPFQVEELAGLRSPLPSNPVLSQPASFDRPTLVAVPRTSRSLLLLDGGDTLLRRVDLDAMTVATLQQTTTALPFTALAVSLDGALVAFAKDYKLYTLNPSVNIAQFQAGSTQGMADGVTFAAQFQWINSVAISSDKRYVYAVHFKTDSTIQGVLRCLDLTSSPARITTIVASDARLGGCSLATSPMQRRLWAASATARTVSQIEVAADQSSASFEAVYGSEGEGGLADDTDPGYLHLEKFQGPAHVSVWACGRPGYDCDAEDYYALPCVPGSAGDGFSACQPCPPGTFAGNTASQACAPCPPNTYADVQLSTACTACPARCPQDTYLAGCGQASAGTCAPCSKDCAADQFRAGCAGQSEGACSPCAAQPAPNQYFYDGGFECSLLTCELQLAQGAYWSGSGGGTNATGCTQAPCSNKPNRSAYVAAENLSPDCAYECEVGHGGQACAPCPPGSAWRAQGGCVPCARGQFSADDASTRCQSCAPGSYAQNLSSTSCAPCTEGTFADSPQATHCDACAPGEVSLGGSASCTLCQPGHAALPTNASHCQPCDPGSYAQDPGRTQCSPCQPGAVAPQRASLRCDPCAPGYAAPHPSATECQPCAPGAASASAGASTCDPCAPGSFAQDQASPRCSPCPVNTFADRGGQAACERCPRGRFAPSQGASACEPCAAGFYIRNASSSDPGDQDTCEPCPPGHVSDQDSYACTPCSPGTFASAATPASPPICLQCPAGHVSLPASTACVPCGGGYAALPGRSQQECSPCEEGTASGGVANTRCEACLPGYVAPRGSSACAPCQPGTFADLSRSNATCTPCGEGSYSARATTQCIPCPPGTSPPSPVGPCAPCAPGTFAPAQGSAACSPCQAYAFANASGSTACSSCPLVLNATLVPAEGARRCAFLCQRGTVLARGACAPLNASAFYTELAAVIAKPADFFTQDVLDSLGAAVAQALAQASSARPVARRVHALLQSQASAPAARRLLAVFAGETHVFFLIESEAAQDQRQVEAWVHGDAFQASLNAYSRQLDFPAIVLVSDAPTQATTQATTQASPGTTPQYSQPQQSQSVVAGQQKTGSAPEKPQVVFRNFLIAFAVTVALHYLIRVVILEELIH